MYAYTCLAILIGVVPQLYAFEFYKDREPYHPLKNAIFASIHRMLLVLPFAVSGALYVPTDYSKLYKKFVLLIYTTSNVPTRMYFCNNYEMFISA